MKHVIVEKTNKLGFLVSTKKPISKKQMKVVKTLMSTVSDFSRFYNPLYLDNVRNFWNSLSPEVRNHPNAVILGTASSTNYCGHSVGNISPKGIKSRSENILKLLDYRIHKNHKMSLFDFIAKVYKHQIHGSGIVGYYMNDPMGWIKFVNQPRVALNTSHSAYLENPWVNESDWNTRCHEVGVFISSNMMAFRDAISSISSINSARTGMMRELTVPSLRQKYEDIQDRISNTSPIHWSRHLDQFSYKLATRQKPEGECIGIELEFICQRDSDIQDWDSSDFPTGRWFSFTTDGSITTDSSDEGIARFQEFKAFLNINDPKDWQTIRNTLTTITDSGAMINKTCGCHVHVDMRNRPQATYYRIAGRVRNAFIHWLHRILSPRRATNRYCSVWADSSNSRYSAVNTHCWNEHRTIEIRVGMPTLNYHKLEMWSKLMFWVVNNSTHIDTFEEFMNSDCPLELKVYVIERIDKFNKLWESWLNANHTICGHPTSPTSMSLPTWSKWVNVVNAVKHTNNDYSIDPNFQ